VQKTLGVLVSLVLAAAATGCGQERAALEPPQAESSRVAMTVSYPGVAPWALITYQGSGGKRCSALGTLTGSGPRVLRAPEAELETGLAGAGRCLGTRSVSLDVSSGAGGTVRVVGGIAASGIKRVVIGGEPIRPGRSGAFLVTQPGGGRLGDSVELVWSSGGRETVPLADVGVAQD
jgi:hypothetical protein